MGTISRLTARALGRSCLSRQSCPPGCSCRPEQPKPQWTQPTAPDWHHPHFPQHGSVVLASGRRGLYGRAESEPRSDQLDDSHEHANCNFDNKPHFDTTAHSADVLPVGFPVRSDNSRRRRSQTGTLRALIVEQVSAADPPHVDQLAAGVIADRKAQRQASRGGRTRLRHLGLEQEAKGLKGANLKPDG